MKTWRVAWSMTIVVSFMSVSCLEGVRLEGRRRRSCARLDTTFLVSLGAVG